MTKPNGYRVNGTMYPARTDLCEQAMLDYIWELEEERDNWTQRWIDERAENKGLEALLRRWEELERGSDSRVGVTQLLSETMETLGVSHGH